MFSPQEIIQHEGVTGSAQKARGEMAQTMFTLVSKCKNAKKNSTNI
jgi:hypothetical protein